MSWISRWFKGPPPVQPKAGRSYVVFENGHMKLDLNAYLKTDEGKAAVQNACAAVPTAPPTASKRPSCSTCNDNHMIGGLTRTGYESEPCPICSIDGRLAQAERLIADIIADQSWRTNDNTLWPRLVRFDQGSRL